MEQIYNIRCDKCKTKDASLNRYNSFKQKEEFLCASCVEDFDN